MVSAVDIFPTVAGYAGTILPEGRVYDGFNVAALLEGRSSQSPRSEFYFYTANKPTIEGVRQGDWKLRIATPRLTKAQRKRGDKPKTAVEMYNLRKDIGESNNLATQHPERVTSMKKVMDKFDVELKADRRPSVTR